MNFKKICAAALSIALCLSLTGCIFDFSKLPEFPTRENTAPSYTPQPVEIPAVTAQPVPEEETPDPDEHTYIEPPEPEAEPLPVGSWLYGSWYGWWIISGADGDYTPYAGKWADVLVKAEYNAENATAEISLTDENGKLGSVTASALNEELFVSEDGSFFDTAIGRGTWQLSRNAYGCEDFVVLKDLTVSNENGSFTYSLYIKPWGSTWDDVELLQESQGDYYSDMLPYRYADYLKMLDSMQAVPDSFKNFG